MLLKYIYWIYNLTKATDGDVWVVTVKLFKKASFAISISSLYYSILPYSSTGYISSFPLVWVLLLVTHHEPTDKYQNYASDFSRKN